MAARPGRYETSNDGAPRALAAARLAARAADASIGAIWDEGTLHLAIPDALSDGACAALETLCARLDGPALTFSPCVAESEAPGIGAFAAVPLESGGFLVVADPCPRDWGEPERGSLADAALVLAERERTRARLRESRRLLSTLLGNLPGAAYRCHNDPRWTLDFISDAAFELTGWTAEELTGGGMSFADLIVPADRDRVWAEVQAAVAEDRAFRLDYRITSRDGTERWVEEHGVGVSEPGRPVMIEGFITDITERKLAETALRRSGDYFRALTEAAGEVVAVGNADGTLRYVSPGVTALTGYTPREWVLMRGLEAVHPEDVPGANAKLQRLLASPGSAVELEMRIVHRSGSWRTVEVHARNLLDDPAVNGIVYNTRDVSARREGEEALRRRERHFRSLIENAHDLITVLEGDGDVRFASPSVERTLGYDRRRFTGVYLFDFVHPDDVASVLKVFGRAIRSPGEPQWAEFRIRHANGSWRMIEAIATSLLHDPAVTGIVVNSRDVTERRQAEEALRLSQQQLLQAQKMDAVGRLAGGVAHDFNNLLTAIRGNAELLLLDLPDPDPRRGDVEEIRHAADRAAALTRQLLAFSRRQVLQPRVLDLNGVVGEMERMLRRVIGEDVELVTRLAGDLRPVRADPGQLEQVVMNLAVNARDAMPGGGTVIVETRNETLGEEILRARPYVVPGEYAMLCVRDTGLGMDGETVERAFEPFFTTKPAGRGTGLGLSTVYGIVKQSGGFVWIDSAPGEGTTVRMYLPPVGGPVAVPGGAAPSQLASRGAGTVLLAEDEATVRRLAVRVLRRGGFTVLEAGDGDEALKVAREHGGPLHLLVADVVMPRLGGRELAARLGESRPGIPVLYVSGYAEEAVAGDGVLDPDTRFLPKPFTGAQLLDAVHAAIRAASERNP